MTKNTKIAVIGLDYVELSLPVDFGKKIKIGFDIKKDRINHLGLISNKQQLLIR